MASLCVTNSFSPGTTAVSSQVNTNFSDVTTYINNRNSGSSAWDALLVAGASVFQANGLFGAAAVGGATATATTGGSLGAATYYYKVYPVFGSVVGQPSIEKSVVVGGANNAVSLSWSSATGATAYRVSRGTSQGSQSGYYTVTATSYTDTGASFTGAGNAFSQANSNWLELSGNLLLPASSGQIYWRDYVDGTVGAFIGPTSSGEMEYRTPTNGSAIGNHVFEDGSDKVILKLNRTSTFSEIIAYGTSGSLDDLDLTFGNNLHFNPGGPTKVTITSASSTFAHQLIGQGTTTNDSASAGYLGEAVRSSIASGSAVNAGTSAQFSDVTSISLTAGDWDVSGIVGFTANGATVTAANAFAAISTNSGNTTTDHVTGDNQIAGMEPTATYDRTLEIPTYRMSLSGTTTVYLKGRVSYSAGTPKFYGRISARRVR